MDTKTKEILLDAAIKIGKRICSQALWQDEKCTWEITTPDMSGPKIRKGIKAIAGPTVYQGTSGIAIFLSELFRITKDKTFLKTASAAIKFALEAAKNLPINSFGFQSGKTGIGYSTFLLGMYSKNENLMKEALDTIFIMEDHELEDIGIDVIGGAGGAIQPILKLYEFTKDERLFKMAVNLGESLIKKANMEIHGWSWASGNSNYRNLCGYAHGASGIGHAFLELYNQTSSIYYLYAAEQTFLYERQFFNSEQNNWPDFRCFELSEYIRYNQIEELKKTLKDNIFCPYQYKYMSAWCHGAPGIGLSRLRAYELTGNKTYKQESINACTATIQSLKQPNANYSLCHGLFGNAETLLIGSRILDNMEYINIITELVKEGIKNFENKNIPWLCGTMNSVSDPSLLVGEAGIGLFILRIADENTVSPLVFFPKLINISKSSTQTEKELQQLYVDKYFHDTITIISRQNWKGINNLEFKPGENISDVEKTYLLIENYIDSSNENVKSKLNDFFILEKEKFISYKSLVDYTKEYLEKISIDDETKIKWEDKIFSLNYTSKLIKRKYNWEEVLKGNQVNSENINDSDGYYLLYLFNNRILVKEIEIFLFVILSTLEIESNYDTLLKTTLNAFEVEEDKINKLKMKLDLQLNDLYRSGIIKTIDKSMC